MVAQGDGQQLIEVIQNEGQNSDGYSWFTIFEGEEEIASLYAYVATQKGFAGTTLRVREFNVYETEENTTIRMSKVFGALFEWNEADNMKFYLRSNDLSIVFTLFGDMLVERKLINDMEKHPNWVIYRGVR
ncbi:hypothetical protein OAT45_03520 [Alphaproteobacteria bacterium]|nr:hypothetical protein [Alphaproteobacteria bacterium]